MGWEDIMDTEGGDTDEEDGADEVIHGSITTVRVEQVLNPFLLLGSEDASATIHRSETLRIRRLIFQIAFPDFIGIASVKGQRLFHSPIMADYSVCHFYQIFWDEEKK